MRSILCFNICSIIVRHKSEWTTYRKYTNISRIIFSSHAFNFDVVKYSLLLFYHVKLWNLIFWLEATRKDDKGREIASIFSYCPKYWMSCLVASPETLLSNATRKCRVVNGTETPPRKSMRTFFLREIARNTPNLSYPNGLLSDALPVRRESQFRLGVAKRISASLLKASGDPVRLAVVFYYLTLRSHQAHLKKVINLSYRNLITLNTI